MIPRELIEFVAMSLFAAAGSILGFHVLGPIVERLLGRGDK